MKKINLTSDIKVLIKRGEASKNSKIFGRLKSIVMVIYHFPFKIKQTGNYAFIGFIGCFRLEKPCPKLKFLVCCDSGLNESSLDNLNTDISKYL